MRYEDERYVRLYTRNTGTWVSLGWEGRFVLMSLLRQVDRAGVLDVVAGEEVATIAALIFAPEAVVRPGLDSLILRGVVVLGGDQLRMPKFMEAQESRTSDRERQRKSRELASLGHTPSHAVTVGHTPSRLSPLAVPSLAVPSRTKPKKQVKTFAGVDIRVDIVFEHWRKLVSPKAFLDQKRFDLVLARLCEGRTPEDLTRAIDGYLASPFHQGANDNGKKHLGLELIMRDASKVEAGWRYLEAPSAAKPAFGLVPRDAPVVYVAGESKMVMP